MATVYRGVQQSLQRPVAIKVLSSTMRAHDEVRDSFERESLIVARLSHPNIVSVIDRGVSQEGAPFFVMEFVDGVDLSYVMREGQLSLNRKLELILQVAKALAYAHKNGVIHRDIKPGNILVDSDWQVRVVDFGIAQLLTGALSRKAQVDEEVSEGRDAGLIMGTEAYMAPEVKLSSNSSSVQSDVYSLGVVLFELLTGRLPDGTPTLPSVFSSDVPKSLDRLVLKCLAPKAEQRPQRAEQVCDQLLELLHGSHLDSGQIKRAEGTLDKKAFRLLDVWRESSSGAVYLFVERNTRKRYVIKKSIDVHEGYQASKVLSGLTHDRLLKVHGVSKNERAFIAVMDYMSGGNLQDRLARPYPLREFLRVATQIAQGLSFAHQQGVVHGYLVPRSVLFDGQDNVKLSDFGWPSHRIKGVDIDVLGGAGDANAAYVLPEEPSSVVRDVYSCGVMFYRMLVGDMPRFTRGRLAKGDVFKRLPLILQELLISMLSVETQERPQKASEVLERLSRVEGAMPTQVWNDSSPDKVFVPMHNEKDGERKKTLLFLLIVLLFIVLVNSGVIAVFEGVVSLAPLFSWLL